MDLAGLSFKGIGGVGTAGLLVLALLCAGLFATLMSAMNYEQSSRSPEIQFAVNLCGCTSQTSAKTKITTPGINVSTQIQKQTECFRRDLFASVRC